MSEKGAFYGWPYSYIGSHPQPGFAKQAPEKVKAAVVPDVLFEAHSSALDLVFYDGEQFPEDYRGDAFVALKGSWNRSDPTGYKVVRVPFKDGRPEAGYENFATGFWVSGRERAEVWGRPAALAVTKDGALLVPTTPAARSGASRIKGSRLSRPSFPPLLWQETAPTISLLAHQGGCHLFPGRTPWELDGRLSAERPPSQCHPDASLPPRLALNPWNSPPFLGVTWPRAWSNRRTPR